MAQEREQAQAELTRLLESAIEKVKHLRLDYVTEVTELFEEAFHYLESNLVLEESTSLSADKLRNAASVTAPKSVSGGVYVPAEGLKNNFGPRTVTSDYSSPDIRGRVLGGKRPKKVSGRATATTRSNRFSQIDDASDSGSGSDDDFEKKSLIGGNKPKLGLGIGGGKSKPNPMMAKPGGKLMLGAKTFTRDYDSPSLGKRSLGGGARKNQGGSSSKSMLGLGGSRSGRKNPFEDDDDDDQPRVAPAVSNFHKEIDPVASPANMAASRNLINMAKKDDRPHGESTPKATYLRRLDSPGSNHEKLRQGREKLTKMLKNSMSLLHRMDLDKYLTIKLKFQEAFEKLESGKIVERKPE